LPAGWNVTAADWCHCCEQRGKASFLGNLIGFKPSHFQNIAERVEAIAARNLSKLTCECSYVLGCTVGRFVPIRPIRPIRSVAICHLECWALGERD
jgi:hypothetical protein